MTVTWKLVAGLLRRKAEQREGQHRKQTAPEPRHYSEPMIEIVDDRDDSPGKQWLTGDYPKPSDGDQD